MKTLAVFDMLASVFADMTEKIDSSSEHTYKESLNDARLKIAELIKDVRMIDPIKTLIQTSGEKTIDEGLAHKIIERIAYCANNRKELGPIFTGASYSRVVQRTVFNYPKYVDFSEKPHVLIEPYSNDSWADFAVRMMNQIALGCLMSIPKGRVNINIINPSMSNKGSLLVKNLPKELCTSFIDLKEITELIDILTNRIKKVLRGESIGTPQYELVLLLDYPRQFEKLTDKMEILIEKGGDAGIHFIVLNDQRYDFDSDDIFDILSLDNDYFHEFGTFRTANKEDYDHILFNTFEICKQPALMQACFEYLNNKKSEIKKEPAEVTSIDETGYYPVDGGLNVSVGEPLGPQTMEFCLGQVEHVHSFIIGQSGKGKSVLLNNIIIKAIQKYSPQDLQLYLLDCKEGGVEFNRYKEVKHVRALLVDNSDILVILEILRDLREEMGKRGKLFREAGVQKIDDYNKTHTDNRMSRIWVVIDECQVIFEQNDTSEKSTKNKIREILSKVAKEGRSQGIHLIMATQTLANTDIPRDILNQITDRYILNSAPSDSDYMCPNSSRITSTLGIGDVYYHNTGNILDTQFHTTYLPKEEVELQINTAVKKAEELQSNGQFYFNGSQMFNFTQDVIESLSTIRRDNLKACPGRAISLKQSPTTFSLKQDMSENVLITGIDEEEQSTRTAIDLLFSLIACNTKATLNYQFYVFDFKNDEESEYIDVLEQLENEGKLTLVKKKEMGSLLKRYVDEIKSGEVEPSVFLLLSQQRFSELKLDTEINTTPKNVDAFGSMNFKLPELRDTTIKTYKEALSFILDNGPENHVHTILQVNKPDNLLFEGYISYKFVFRKFRHLILLHSDDTVASILGLPVGIRLDLNSSPERLRAIYYADGDEGWTLFSPFVIPDKEIISSITNKK